THAPSFLDGFLPEGTEVGEDGDVWAFMTPAMTSGDVAVTGAGEILGAFSDDEATQKVLTYLSTPEWANNHVSLGGVVSAKYGLDPNAAQSPILQESIRILQDENTSFRFDASDLMPGAVGAGTFWKGMVAWINGTSTAEVVEQIET